MKRLFLIILVILISGCNSDNSPDCFKKQGEMISKRVSTEAFSKISISTGIELIVKQSGEYDVTVETGKNLINRIHFEVENSELKITNDSNCGILSDYHPAKVYISTPELEKIHTGSQYAVKSDGVLRFPELLLEAGIITERQPPGWFEIEVDNEKLRIYDDVSSVFKIKGKTKDLEIKFWGGAGRLEAGNLLGDNVHFYHRSSNDIIVHPVSRVKGTLAGTGNLVLKNVPDIMDIEQLYTGHIVYP